LKHKKKAEEAKRILQELNTKRLKEKEKEKDNNKDKSKKGKVINPQEKANRTFKKPKKTLNEINADRIKSGKKIVSKDEIENKRADLKKIMEKINKLTTEVNEIITEYTNSDGTAKDMPQNIRSKLRNKRQNLKKEALKAQNIAFHFGH